MSDHGLSILNFSVYHEVLSKSKICMILVKTCTSVVLFNYRQHIFLFYWESWTSCVCLIFAKRKPVKRISSSKHDRKNTKYKKKSPVKVHRLTIYVWKSIKVRRDWWLQINFWQQIERERVILKFLNEILAFASTSFEN